MASGTKQQFILEMFELLEKLYSYEDADINGGDLVDAIGLCVNNKFGAGLSRLDEMLADQEG